MKYQQIFASMYMRAPSRRGLPPLSAAALVRLAAPLWACAERLGLPQLLPWQRRDLGEADVPELRPLMLAYSQLLSVRPEIGRALHLSPAFMEGLRHKEVALCSLIEMLEQLLQAIADVRLCAVAEIAHVNGRVADAVTRVSADEALPPAERDAELAGFGSVRRLREERQARRRRAVRRTERRLVPLRAQLRDLNERAEATQLATGLAGAAAAPAAAVVPAGEGAARQKGTGAARPRWLGSERAGALLIELRRGGAPLDRCLSADATEIDACTGEIGQIKGQLAAPGITTEERRELSGRDPIKECGLALANAQALRAAPRVAEAAGTTPKALEEACQVLLSMDRLELGSSILLRDAVDGRAVAIGMVALLHQKAQGWLADRLEAGDLGEDDRRLLLGDFAATLGIAEQAGERRERQEARAERRAEELSAQVAAAEEEAHLSDTVARLRAGAEVDKDALARAAAAKSSRRRK